MHRLGINYVRRIRCMTVGTEQITPPLPNKKRVRPQKGPTLFLFGSEHGLKSKVLFGDMLRLLALGFEIVRDLVDTIGPFARRHPVLDEP